MRLFRALATCVALVSTAGCAPPDREAELPDGVLLVARTPALAQILARLADSSGTPIARESGALLRRLPDCDHVESRAPLDRPAELAEKVRCADPRGALAPLHALRVDAAQADLAFALPLGDVRILGTATVGEGGDVEFDLRVPDAAFDGALALLEPGTDPPGLPLLSSRDTLLHARLRPRDGVNVARFVPDAGQAALLFQLKSEIFSGAVLDGTWEAAVYRADTPGRMPHTAAAVGFTHRDAAIGAMEAFVADLESSWPIRRVPFRTGDHEGACLPGLRVLPELAPCYVATDRALVVGWNPASVRAALESDAGAPDLGAFGGLVIHLERLRGVRIGRDESGEIAADAPASAWRRLAAHGRGDADEVRIRVTLKSDA